MSQVSLFGSWSRACTFATLHFFLAVPCYLLVDKSCLGVCYAFPVVSVSSAGFPAKIGHRGCADRAEAEPVDHINLRFNLVR